MKTIDFDNADLAIVLLGIVACLLAGGIAFGNLTIEGSGQLLVYVLGLIGTLATPGGLAKLVKRGQELKAQRDSGKDIVI